MRAAHTVLGRDESILDSLAPVCLHDTPEYFEQPYSKY